MYHAQAFFPEASSPQCRMPSGNQQMYNIVFFPMHNKYYFLEIISVDKKVNLLLITDVKRQLITVITQVN
jgi:hypothetical protein